MRPRRVFRELSVLPIGVLDYLLAAAQGVAVYLAFSRAKSAELHLNAWQVLGNSLSVGPLAGVASVVIFSTVYSRLGARAGGKSTRNQVFHVLAYGGLPVVATLGLWAVTAALIGDAAFVDSAGTGGGFVGFIGAVQSTIYVLLLLWSVVLQVMGFSEIHGIETRKAFGVWLLGQLLGLLAAIVLAIAIALLFPSLLPEPP